MRFVSNVVKMMIVILLLFVWFENLGFNVIILLVGLGIGGFVIVLVV